MLRGKQPTGGLGARRLAGYNAYRMYPQLALANPANSSLQTMLDVLEAGCHYSPPQPYP
jgi:hypothetical protein